MSDPRWKVRHGERRGTLLFSDDGHYLVRWTDGTESYVHHDAKGVSLAWTGPHRPNIGWNNPNNRNGATHGC